MLTSLNLTRLWREIALVVAVSAALSFISVGTASAQPDVTPQTATKGPYHVFGLQTSTLAWLLLGVLVLTSGLIASSHGWDQPVAPSASTDAKTVSARI